MKNISPLKIYLHGNITHFAKSCMAFMLEKQNVLISKKGIRNDLDGAIFWNPRMDREKNTTFTKEIANRFHFINFFLINTDKDYVANVFDNFFKQKLMVNPETYEGYCIAKHNSNGTKSCIFLKCPINANEIFKNHTYQKLINFTSKEDPEILHELRVSIFGNIIPFVFFKKREKSLRFTCKNIEVEIAPGKKYLSEKEMKKILLYCRRIGLEYGEVDVLRSDSDNNIYIIDVNNTPHWPPNNLSEVDKNIALNLFWNSFLEIFFPKKFNELRVKDCNINDYIPKKNEEKDLRKFKYNDIIFRGNLPQFPYKIMLKEFFNDNNNLTNNYNLEKTLNPVQKNKNMDMKMKKDVKKTKNKNNVRPMLNLSVKEDIIDVINKNKSLPTNKSEFKINTKSLMNNNLVIKQKINKEKKINEEKISDFNTKVQIKNVLKNYIELKNNRSVTL